MDASSSTAAQVAEFACHCLNVTISARSRPQAGPGGLPALPQHPDFNSHSVVPDGIRVIFPRATLKSRSDPTWSNKQRIEWVRVTCLFCRHLVYQVRTENFSHGETIPSNVKQWVDHVVFKSVSGWIQIHKDCLTGDAIRRVRESPDYSPHMSIFVSKESQASATPIRASPVPSSVMEAHTSLLPELPQFMPPPPLISQHPAFSQLASQAIAASQRARERAEEKVLAAARESLHVLDEEEERIRSELSLLWYGFKKGYQDHLPSSDSGRSSPATPGSSLDSRTFAPRPIAKLAVSAPARPSGLSQSLSTLGMLYHPPQPPPSPPSSSSSTLVIPPSGVEYDQATSFRWTQNALEEARTKAATEAAQAPPQPVPQPTENKSPPRKRVQSVPTGSAFRTRSPDPEVEDRKGKRRVTFDANPKVVTITQGPTRPGSSSKRERSGSTDEVELFDLDMADLINDDAAQSSPLPSPTLAKEVKLPRAKHSPLRSGAPAAWATFAQLTSSLPAHPDGIANHFPDRPVSMRSSSFTLPPSTPTEPARASSSSDASSSSTPTSTAPFVNGKGKGKVKEPTGSEGGYSDDDDSELELEIEMRRAEAEEMAQSLPRSLPMATPPVWTLGQRSFHPLASVAETPGDYALLNEIQQQSTGPMARTYSEEVDAMITKVATGVVEPPIDPQSYRSMVLHYVDQERGYDEGRYFNFKPPPPPDPGPKSPDEVERDGNLSAT